MNEMISNAWETIITKLSGLIYGKRKFTLTTDYVDDKFSIVYSKIPLPKECKHIQVFYAREAIFEYKTLQSLIIDYVKLEDMNLISIIDTLLRYIEGWSNFKELTPAMLDTLGKMIDRRMNILSYHRQNFEQHLAEFKRYNDDPSCLVDNFVMTLFRYNTDVQYSRIFKHFFKKGGFDLKYLQKRYDSEIHRMEALLHSIQRIEKVRQYSGKTDEVNVMRREAAQFIKLIQKMSDLIEEDLNFIEEMSQINKLVIAFKVYPYYGRSDDD